MPDFLFWWKKFEHWIAKTFENKERFEILSIDLKNVIRNYMSPLQKLKFEKVGIWDYIYKHIWFDLNRLSLNL